MALASRYHGAKITAGTMVLYYGEAEAVLTAALPHLRRQVIEECLEALDGVQVDPFVIDPEETLMRGGWGVGLIQAEKALRALLADAGQPKEGE